MNEYEAYETIMKQICKEMNELAEKIKKNGTMSEQDLEKIDKLAHAKKSLLTASAMEEAQEYEDVESGASGARTRMTYSGRRGRGMDGRFVSRDSRDSYSEGYNRGYSEAMNRAQDGNSGHYPMPYYPDRW